MEFTSHRPLRRQMSGSICRSSDGPHGQPWTRQRRSSRLGTHGANGGFYRSRQPVKDRDRENQIEISEQ